MEGRRPIPDGAAAGLVAGLAVIVIFFLYDVVRMTPLATPFEMAGILFGTEGPGTGLSGTGRLAAIASALFRMLAYTGFHFLVFAALGATAVAFFDRLKLPLNVVTGGIYGLVVCTAVLYGAFWLVWSGISAPSLTGVMLANVVAGVVLALRLQSPASTDST
jgi:hypothetical protein